MMDNDENTAELFREMVRLFIRDQRQSAACLDAGQTVRCHILNELLRDAPLSQQALVERLGLDKGWISRAVDALQAEGSLSKEPNERDRRSVMLVLTSQGKTLAATLNRQLNCHAASLLAHVPPEQQAALRGALQSLQSALKNNQHKSRTTRSR